MTRIDVAKLAVIPFLDHTQLPGCALFTQTFYDGRWRSWADAQGNLIEVQMWPAESAYFGSSREAETDICFHFLDVIAQKLCVPVLTPQFFGLLDDIFNLSASLAKVRLLHDARIGIANGVHRMVATEIEYIYVVCRSLFDLWQEVVANFWHRTHLLQTSVPKRELKESYQNMVFSGEQPRTVESLTQQYGLPKEIAECYTGSAGFFADMRKFRDTVVHSRSRVQIVFVGETDFLIQESRMPFRNLNIWRTADRLENDLVPLQPALAYVIFQTLATCDNFSRTIERTFGLPKPIVPGMQLFLRGYFNDLLIQAMEDSQRRLLPQT